MKTIKKTMDIITVTFIGGPRDGGTLQLFAPPSTMLFDSDTPGLCHWYIREGTRPRYIYNGVITK